MFFSLQPQCFVFLFYTANKVNPQTSFETIQLVFVKIEVKVRHLIRDKREFNPNTVGI